MRLASLLASALLFFLAAIPLRAVDDVPLSARDLASKMAAAVEDGSATARVRMKSVDGPTLQVQIKSRRAGGRAEVCYEVLWPNERKGQAFVLRRSGAGRPEGTSFTPPDKRAALDRSQLSHGVFGTELTYADTIDNFFLWPQQQGAGREVVDRVDCIILESKPGADAIEGKVRSWIDPRRMVVMRVEKYDDSGRLLRTITTTQVAKDDLGRHVPAGLKVTHPSGTTTEIDGANIRHDVRLTDTDFEVGAEKGAP